MTTLQKQALFTLRQALALCEEAGIEICACYPANGDSELYLRQANRYHREHLQASAIDQFEKELGE